MSACTLVIPCFNETSRLDLRAFVEHAARHDHRFLFVNDGSSDGTGELLEDFCASWPEMLSVLQLPRNVGKADAVRQGVLAAMDSSDARFVGYWDADLATPLAAIDQMERYLREHATVELLLGARVQLLGRNIIRRPLRHYLGRLFATAASCVLRLPVYDTQCGAKLFRASAAMRRAFAEPFLTRWLFDVELLARLIVQNDAAIAERIHEFPLSSWQDVAGSKVKATDFGQAAWQLLRIYRQYPELRQERPPTAKPEQPAGDEQAITAIEERTLEELIQ
jgi:glycosyltransferase involved in cell wall biosynthesis